METVMEMGTVREMARAKPKDFDMSFGLEFDFMKGIGGSKSEKLFGDMGFTNEFQRDQDEQDIQQNDPLEPQLISDDFEEPADMVDRMNEEQEFEPQPFEEMALFSQLPKISIGTRIPKTDPKVPRVTRLRRKFRKVRKQALETGGNPLSPEEDRDFNRGPAGRTSGQFEGGSVF